MFAILNFGLPIIRHHCIECSSTRNYFLNDMETLKSNEFNFITFFIKCIYNEFLFCDFTTEWTFVLKTCNFVSYIPNYLFYNFFFHFYLNHVSATNSVNNMLRERKM